MLGLLGANWKLIAGAVAITAVFGAGWTVNGWRYEAEYREAEREIFDEIAERRAALVAEFEDLRQVDDLARSIMATDLVDMRARNDALQAEIETASLVKTEPQVVIQWRDRVVREESDEICGPPVLANPFSVEFVQLFNKSTDQRGRPMPGTDSSG